jgi:hypothetical protein
MERSTQNNQRIYFLVSICPPAIVMMFLRLKHRQMINMPIQLPQMKTVMPFPKRPNFVSFTVSVLLLYFFKAGKVYVSDSS